MTKKTATKTADPVLFDVPEEPSAPKLPEVQKPAKAKTTAVAKVEHLPPPTNMLAIIASAAANPNVDVSKMRELLTMQREIMAEEARVAFTQDFIAMSAKMPSINRDGCIVIEEKAGKRGQRTPFATFENIHRTVGLILRDHGFAYWSEPDLGDDRSPIIMRCHLDHISGHGKSCAIPLPFETSGSKNNVQGVGSSLSYGRRYGILNLCNIVSHAPEDVDRDGHDEKTTRTRAAIAEKNAPTPETINGSQAKELLKLIDECGVEATVFMGKYGIKAIHELPANLFDEAKAACQSYKERVAKSQATK